MKLMLVTTVFFLAHGFSLAQSERSLVNDGNGLYEEEKFDAAEIQYRKALRENEESVPGRFNLGNALHKQGKFEQSISEFKDAASSTIDPTTRRDALFNTGNSFAEAEQYDAAIAAYSEALKLDPTDSEAKYNLSYAIMKKAEQEQQQQEDQQDQENNDENQDQNQPQQNDPQGNDDQERDPEEQDGDQGPPPEQQQDKNQQPQMSKADAERILEVLKNNEKEVQKQLRAKPQQRTKSEKDW